MAVCHPFQARLAIRTRRSVLGHAVVFIIGVIVNIPLFMRFTIQSICMPCPDDTCWRYYLIPTSLVLHYKTFIIIWGILGTFLPLLLLCFCNVNILAVVCRADSLRIRDSLATRENQSRIFTRVTITLVVMVFMYLTLVTPSMILACIRPFVKDMTDNQFEHFKLAITLTNFCQAIKFSSNFMLYCVVNKQFRDSAASNMNCKTISSRTTTPECSNTSNKRYQIVGPQS